MSATGRRVEFLARAIVNRLEDRAVVECLDAEAGIMVVARAIQANFVEIEAIERAARQKLGRRATDEQIDKEMRRIAAERDTIL